MTKRRIVLPALLTVAMAAVLLCDLHFSAAQVAGGGGGAPGGTNGQIQYNSNGAFAGYGLGTGLGVSAGNLIATGTSGLTLNHIFVGNASNNPADVAMAGDCTIVAAGTVTCLKTNGTNFSALATTVPGTGVATALGVNVGTAGAFVVNGGALGTPSSGTLTNATGLPISTGISGLGTGVATALAAATNGSTGVVAGLTPTNSNCIIGNGTAWTSGACSGGGSVSVTAGTPNIVITPSPGTGTFTVGTTNAQNTIANASFPYTVLSSDLTKELLLGNTSDGAVLNVPQATTTFGAGNSFAGVTGTNTVLAKSTTSTINGIAGATGIKLGPNQFTQWDSDGTNWRVGLGLPQPATQTSTLYLDDDLQWKTSTGTGSGVRATSPTLVTPTLGAATATTINKVTLTAPATGSTLTIADGKTLTDTSGVGAVLLKGATGGGFAAAAAADIPATTLATGTSVTLTAPREYYVCTGTCTVTPPVPAAGYEFCVMNDDNVATVITLAAIGSSARYENTARTAYGTAGTGTFVSGGAAGDKVCLLGRDSTHYLTVSSNGTWTAN